MSKLAEHSDDIRLADLPPVAQELVQVVGASAALALMDEWGGTRIHVPERCPEVHRLVALMGLDAAKSLCEYAGGDRLEIPRASRALRQVRNRQIREGAARGMSQPQLARTYHLTERHIRNILGQVIDHRQTTLL